jgi:D-alanyl-D-alanine carboxypeptidase
MEQPPGLSRRVGAALSSMVADYGPGLFALVAEDGRVLFSGSAGTADLRVPRPIHESDRFRIGSLTKTYVATLVLQLVDEGALGLDDPLQRHLPGVLASTEPVTVRHLLQLRSGLPDYVSVLARTLDPAVFARYWSPRQLIALSLGEPDRRPPGEEFRYSNTDYILLGLVVEAVTGERLEAALWRRICYPLDMRETDLPSADPYLRGPHATGYLRLPGGEPQEFTTMTPSESWASGAIISTPGEVVRFLDALFNGRLLAREQLAVMFDVQPVDRERAYGCGLYRYLLPDGQAVYGHRGSVVGFSCLAVRSHSGPALVLYRNCLDMDSGPLPIDNPVVMAIFLAIGPARWPTGTWV